MEGPRCRYCGNLLSPQAGICPRCRQVQGPGVPPPPGLWTPALPRYPMPLYQQPYYPYVPSGYEERKSGETYGIIGIISGVIGIFIGGIILGVIAIACGAIAVSKKATTLGIISIALGIVDLFLVIFVILFFLSQGGI